MISVRPQAVERWRFLANVPFVQNDGIMAKVTKFKAPHLRLDLSGVKFFLKHCEHQRKNRELRIDAR